MEIYEHNSHSIFIDGYLTNERLWISSDSNPITTMLNMLRSNIQRFNADGMLRKTNRQYTKRAHHRFNLVGLPYSVSHRCHRGLEDNHNTNGTVVLLTWLLSIVIDNTIVALEVLLFCWCTWSRPAVVGQTMIITTNGTIVLLMYMVPPHCVRAIRKYDCYCDCDIQNRINCCGTRCIYFSIYVFISQDELYLAAQVFPIAFAE